MLFQASIKELLQSSEFSRSLNANLAYIHKILDFRMQKRKMIEILGWEKDVVSEMEANYIKFLALNKTLKDFGLDIKIIPNRLIDEFWHMHILDTQKYIEDCYKIFGKYFHHYPYYGMVDKNDEINWLENARLCQYIWETLFGEKLYSNLDENSDSYMLDKEFYKKLSKLYKNDKEAWVMKCSRCRTCRPVNCP